MCVASSEPPTTIYEDNVACISQMQIGYIKSNITKYVAPKLFYPHELQLNGELNILPTKSCDNLADLFTKSLPTSSFEKCIKGIGMRRIRDLQASGGDVPNNRPGWTLHIVLFFNEFLPLGFSHIKFLTRQCLIQAYALPMVFLEIN
jgi:hypothetical protein